MVSISQLEAAMELNRFCGQDFGSNGGDKQVPTTGAHGGPSDLAQSTTGKVSNVLDSEGNNEEDQ